MFSLIGSSEMHILLEPLKLRNYALAANFFLSQLAAKQ